MRENSNRYVDQITQNVIAFPNIWKIETIIENYMTRSADILNKLGVPNLDSHVQGEKQIGPRLLV